MGGAAHLVTNGMRVAVDAVLIDGGLLMLVTDGMRVAVGATH